MLEEQEASIRKLQVARLQDHRLLLLHFHSVKNFQATLTTAFWGEVWKMLKLFYLKKRTIASWWYLHVSRLLAEVENSHDDRPLINAQEHMRNAIYLVYQYLLKTSFPDDSLRAIKLGTIFVKNEDANEDEDASWKIVYELRMITACLIWNHKARP